jgi:6-pyruvoyltetrahydropterin/6-carboxytetrahydropterin synthase
MLISRRFNFQSAHFLPNVPEDHKCRRRHGHNYIAEITFDGAIDPTLGWVIDFAEIDAMTERLIRQLDHHDLNEIMPNPTAELITMWLVEQLQPQAARKGVRLHGVTVHENERASVTWISGWSQEGLK